MFTDRSVWKLACDMAASGEYANVATIERELRRRGLISGEITGNVYRREFLTRACHAGRDGVRMEFRPSPLAGRPELSFHIVSVRGPGFAETRLGIRSVTLEPPGVVELEMPDQRAH